MATTITSNLFNQARQAAQACNVPSFTERNKTYEVRDAYTPFATCNCADFTFRRQSLIGDDRVCKHIAFARHGVLRIVELCRELRDVVEDPLPVSS